jgi:nucleoside-diphosphate-sugar epimerase
MGDIGYEFTMPTSEARLTVAVTGPTGTFGFGLVPLLQGSPRVARVVGIARRPFDPVSHGWRKMEYRRGDVRDPPALSEAFQACDVVVHLAVPTSLVYAAARAAAAPPQPPFAPPATGWVEAISHPAIMDTSKAKRELGWRPRYTGIEALRATLRAEDGAEGTPPDAGSA